MTKIKYTVWNERGCLLGGAATLETAERIKRDWEKEERENPFVKKPARIFIKEEETAQDMGKMISKATAAAHSRQQEIIRAQQSRVH